MREEIRKRAEMIRRGDVPEGYKKTKVGIIPVDWKITSIKKVSELIVSNVDKKIKVGEDNVHLCNYMDVYSNSFIDLSLDFMESTAKPSEINKFQLKENDVLITKDSETREDIAISSFVKETTKKLLCGYHLAIIRPKSISGFYLNYLLKQSLIRNQFVVLANGVTRFGLTKESINKVEILFPDLNEQTAIAQILSTSDKAIETTETLINLKEQKKKWLMQNLLTGKVRLRGFKGEWNKLRLGEVATFSKGKGLSKNQISPKGKTPCIHYGELFTFYPEIINVIASYTDISKNMVYSQKNDVLMPTSDVTPNGLAKASSIMLDKVIIGGDILIIKPNRNIVFGPFLSYHIRESRNVILRLVSGITVYHLYAKDMKKYPLFIPEYDEQQAIANVLTTADKEIDLLNKKLDTLKQQKKALMQLLLTGIVRTTGLNLSSDTEEEGVAYVQ